MPEQLAPDRIQTRSRPPALDDVGGNLRIVKAVHLSVNVVSVILQPQVEIGSQVALDRIAALGYQYRLILITWLDLLEGTEDDDDLVALLLLQGGDLRWRLLDAYRERVREQPVKRILDRRKAIEARDRVGEELLSALGHWLLALP